MAAADGGTGSPDERPDVADQQGSPDVADLYEYCLSLGVDADQDEDLLWVVHEAFNAPLPGNVAEYTNEEGRVYYFNEVTGQSSWEHPLDQVYREVLSLVKQVRTEAPRAPEEQREAIVKDHLQQVHKRARIGLDGWSGPYASEQGDYYHNEVLQVSSWESPIEVWERELEIRHGVLCRCMLAEKLSRQASKGGSSGTSAGGSSMANLLPSLRLPLDLLKRDSTPSHGVPQTPSTARSFHTARSSARSGGSTRSKKRSVRSHGSEDESRRRDRQERRAAREQRKQEGSGTPGSASASGTLAQEAPPALPDFPIPQQQ